VRAAGLALVAAVLVAGCGSSSTSSGSAHDSRATMARELSHVSLRTTGGFRYTASIVASAAGDCLEQSFELAGRGVEPYEHYVRACASGTEPDPPLLIQSVKPRTALILDRPAGDCGPVRVEGESAATVCSTAKPRLRITTLPARGGAVTVTGIAGVTRVTVRGPRLCKHVCESKL
jgi:hypothetical protein